MYTAKLTGMPVFSDGHAFWTIFSPAEEPICQVRAQHAGFMVAEKEKDLIPVVPQSVANLLSHLNWSFQGKTQQRAQS